MSLKVSLGMELRVAFLTRQYNTSLKPAEILHSPVLQRDLDNASLPTVVYFVVKYSGKDSNERALTIFS